MKVGEKFTLPGRYKRRTLIQWLLRRPRELQVYTVTKEFVWGVEFS